MRTIFTYLWMYLLLSSHVLMGGSYYSDKEIFGYKFGKIGKECLKKAYDAAPVDTDARRHDLEFATCAARGITKCCCATSIANLFKKDTKKITQKRVNPAVDKLIEALRNQRVSSDIKIEELVHLKYANAMYSFYDKDGEKMKKEKLTMPADDEDGCVDTITFRKLNLGDLDRKGVYREGMLKDILALLHAWDKESKMVEKNNMIKIEK